MNDYTNDTQDYVCSITPEEFELFCMKTIKSYAEKENLNNFNIKHNTKIKSDDGVYQIDIQASFYILDLEINLICECKQYKDKVKRDVVQILESKIRSLGANKGVLLSTSGFQKGAIDYAKKHGIALIQVYDHSCEPISHATNPLDCIDEDDPFYLYEKLFPKYKAICITSDQDEFKVLYPTREMIAEIYNKANVIIYG